MLNRAREYRWELWLLLGAPALAWLAQALYYRFAPLEIITFGITYGLFPLLWESMMGDIVWVGLLAASYVWVRRLQRPTLEVAWKYVIAVGLLIVVYLVALRTIRETNSEAWVLAWFYLWMTAYGLILAWFARSASREGFDKSWVILAVALNVGLTWPSVYISIHVAFDTGVIITGVAMSVIAMWALHRSDSGTPLGAIGILVLLGSALVAYVSVIASRYWGFASAHGWDWSTLATELLEPYTGYVFLPLAATFVLAMGVAYAFRTRPKAPPGPDPEFKGLYR